MIAFRPRLTPKIQFSNRLQIRLAMNIRSQKTHSIFKCWVTFVAFAVCSTRLAAADPYESPNGPPNAAPIVIEAKSAERVDLGAVADWLANMSPAAKRGYKHLTESAYLPTGLDDEVAAELGNMLAKREARGANVEATELTPLSREQVLDYYGMTTRPGDEASGKPLQYVVTEKSEWVMNCLTCHGGSVYGTTLPGVPNNSIQLQTFIEDVRTAKLKLGKPLGHMDLGSMFIPLGSTAGTTNAVMFGVGLMHFRDADLNVLPVQSSPKMIHHDMDPPAWWLMHRKSRIYADGFAQKGHRSLMQFMMVRENGPEKFREWESDYQDVLTFIESLRPPKYPHAIDNALAERGRTLFNETCSRCHGTYGDGSKFPEHLVPIEEIGTDRVRLDALSPTNRARYRDSWFAHYGEQETWTDPQGYMAQPLDGIWASAPYFHNGSVPTLWHVLNPQDRPSVWRRTEEAFDSQRVGLTVEELTEVPRRIGDAAAKRTYFDTRASGKSAAGHDFPLELTPEERTAVLEYLKTL